MLQKAFILRQVLLTSMLYSTSWHQSVSYSSPFLSTLMHLGLLHTYEGVPVNNCEVKNIGFISVDLKNLHCIHAHQNQSH